MQCDAVIERLDAFRTGELGGGELDAVRTHLATCSACQALRGDIEHLAGVAQSWRAHAPVELQQEVLAMLNHKAGQDATLRYTTFEMPYGLLHVAFSGATVRYTDLGVSADEFEARCLERIGQRPALEQQPPERLLRAVHQYLEGNGSYRGPVDLSTVSPMQERALRLAMKIRPGEIRSYGWIAREIGLPKATRAVGTAMARNPIPILVPCHRVVRTDYHIGNYGAGGPDKKREILDHEGVNVAELERLARSGIRLQ